MIFFPGFLVVSQCKTKNEKPEGLVNCTGEKLLTTVLKIESFSVFMALTRENSGDQIIDDPWFRALIDSGANRGITYDVNDALPGSFEQKKIKIDLAGVGHTMMAKGTCSVQVISQDGLPFVFRDILVVPGASSKLVSTGTLDEAGWDINHGGGRCKILDKDRLLFSAPKENGLYHLSAPLAKDLVTRIGFETMVPRKISVRRERKGEKSVVGLARAYMGDLDEHDVITPEVFPHES